MKKILGENKLAKEFGARLKGLRIEHGLTQEGLAKKTGLSFSAINQIENGHKFPRPLTRRKLAEALGADDLLNKSPDKPLVTAGGPILSQLRKEIEHFDVIRPSPDIAIFVNPDTPIEQRKIIQEMAVEMRRRVKESK